ncbi:very short patch repair endonuclease [Phycicoccus sp. SLBN-51]|uniref:very short patch repair endonuclease n=1 Tax=Phycicoccus sp. SLBN-51 TaxID=2768447 RepID=UPI001152E42C
MWLREKMSRFPRGETAPEMAVRRALHRKGLRYRVHLPVPGIARRRIDIAFTRRKVAVFIDGCFWHSCPEHGRIPSRNGEWWRWKLSGNARRDRATTQHLEDLGWRVVRCWEHEQPADIVRRIQDALDAQPVRETPSHPEHGDA